jgi:hypothetical protein
MRGDVNISSLVGLYLLKFGYLIVFWSRSFQNMKVRHVSTCEMWKGSRFLSWFVFNAKVMLIFMSVLTLCLTRDTFIFFFAIKIKHVRRISHQTIAVYYWWSNEVRDENSLIVFLSVSFLNMKVRHVSTCEI